MSNPLVPIELPPPSSYREPERIKMTRDELLAALRDEDGDYFQEFETSDSAVLADELEARSEWKVGYLTESLCVDIEVEYHTPIGPLVEIPWNQADEVRITEGDHCILLHAFYD